eukprot:scaffold1505_cov390-Prasinococcus_capsulatus_cf.AAC.5
MSYHVEVSSILPGSGPVVGGRGSSCVWPLSARPACRPGRARRDSPLTLGLEAAARGGCTARELALASPPPAAAAAAAAAAAGAAGAGAGWVGRLLFDSHAALDGL